MFNFPFQPFLIFFCSRCELLERKECKEEFVLLRKLVRENCTVQREFCEAFHRAQTVPSETVVCEQKLKVKESVKEMFHFMKNTASSFLHFFFFSLSFHFPPLQNLKFL